MSYGFRIVNDYGNLAVDAVNPVLMIAGGDQVTLTDLSWSYNDANPVVQVKFAIRFLQPMYSTAPPLVWARSKGGGVETLFQKVYPLGSPNNWLGIGIQIVFPIMGNGSTPWIKDALNAYFPYIAITCAGAMQKLGQTHGIRIRDAYGRIVFDAGNNQAKDLRNLGSWVYEGRDGGDGEYFERWYINNVQAADEFLLISTQGTSFAVRYNDEYAYFYTTIPAYPGQNVRRVIRTGRSGIVLYWPLTVIKEVIPQNGTVLNFANLN